MQEPAVFDGFLYSDEDKMAAGKKETTIPKPKPGDPLVEMLVQGTDSSNLNNRVGGTYGCKRSVDANTSQCDEWAKNIIDFPRVKGKNKVHDGLDLKAPSNTAVYSIYDGTVVNAGYSETLGYYVLIKSTNTEHNLPTEPNTIYISYGHLTSYISDIAGKKIKQGVLIGYTGNSGSIAQNIDTWQYHLHLTVYNGSTSNKYNRVNPAKYLTTKFDDNGNKIK